MRKNSMLFLRFSPTILILVSAISAFGQERPAAPEREGVFERGIAIAGPQGPVPAPAPPGNTFYWVTSEFSLEGKLVKGAPYSAQAVTEITQTLGDGNRIVNRSTATVYRDSEGRTRREQTLKAVGNLAVGEPLQTVLINDPVSGMNYMLDPSTRIARKMPSFRFRLAPPPETDASSPRAAPEPLAFKVTAGNGGETTVTANGGVDFALRQEGVRVLPNPDGPREDVVRESLGKQMIESVDAEGSRTTITIPAGAIGNERPIEIVEERWYSPSLQTVVMTRHSDPRSGEIIYRLTNIDRAEPPRSLFEIPADYQVKEGLAPPEPMRMRRPED